MKKMLFLLIISFIISHVLGQSKYDIVSNYFIDTTVLFSEVEDAIHRCESLNGYPYLKIIPIYLFDDFFIHTKQEYIDGTFLCSLSPRYYQKSELYQRLGIKVIINNKNSCRSNPWLIAVDEFLLVDQHGEFVGKVESGLFRIYTCLSNSDSILYISPKAHLTDLLSTHGFDFLFRTSDYGHFYKTPTVYFGINKQEKRLCVIIHTMYGCKVFPIEEIINYHWDDFQNQLTLLKHEVNNELKQSFENKMGNTRYKFCSPFY